MANLQELLHEYRDTIPGELPARLPPERQIDHEIDLEPESRHHLEDHIDFRSLP